MSYNNHGCGYLLCQYPGAKRWKDNICRYNLSINDGLTNHFSGIYFWAGGSGISDALVYNNVIINARHAIRSTHDIPGLVFRNNILISEKAVIAGPLHQALFESNLYRAPLNGIIFRDGKQVFKTLMVWAQATGKETVNDHLVGLTVDPKLVLPDDLSELPKNPQQSRSMPFFRIQADSPCFHTGKIIEDNGLEVTSLVIQFFQTIVLPWVFMSRLAKIRLSVQYVMNASIPWRITLCGGAWI